VTTGLCRVALGWTGEVARRHTPPKINSKIEFSATCEAEDFKAVPELT
jgi:hypothetical protein